MTHDEQLEMMAPFYRAARAALAAKKLSSMMHGGFKDAAQREAYRGDGSAYFSIEHPDGTITTLTGSSDGSVEMQQDAFGEGSSTCGAKLSDLQAVIKRRS